MGVMNGILSMFFGGGRNVVAETAEVFRVNAEKSSVRDARQMQAAMGQYGQEFQNEKRDYFDRFVDALNRLPRPAMALGTLALLISAMVNPLWFASRMQGLALVPDPLWWLLGAVVSFYFGARYQAKGQEFQTSIVRTLARTPEVLQNIGTINASPIAAEPLSSEIAENDKADANPALAAWRNKQP
ncbi:MAG: holin family protein [Paracoccaceae bacterium]|nr:holin family protein [Paracoccaceae bacterium]